MSEPLRTTPESVPAAGPQRDALIEKLLLAGLDHYFEGSYEQAVNVWTRVAFLERGHGRARAYIERARAALAERQRRAEELLHRGIEAYDAGDLTTARDLLSRAVADGGASDTALVFLQRLGRVQALDAPEPAGRPVTSLIPRSERPAHRSAGVEAPSSQQSPQDPSPTASEKAVSWVATAAASLLIAAAILLAAQPIASWLGERPIEAPATGAPPADPLPIVRASEMRIAQARALHAEGRHHEALAALDAIDVADPHRGTADRLRAEIQGVLLAEAGVPGRESPR